MAYQKRLTPRPADIFIISLGCPRNLVDTEVLAGILKKRGFSVSFDFNENAVCIVNTCGFIEDAKQESIDVILELVSFKKEKRIKKLIVTGCLSQRYSRQIAREIPQIDGVFGCGTFHRIPDYIERILAGEKTEKIEDPPTFLYNDATPREMITPPHSVYVKIQEGCMNYCSFCAIPRMRGKFRSREEISVLREISRFKKNKTAEINFIGQDTTLYGVDIYGRKALSSLLEKASRIMKTGWIRLLYTHPAHYTKELINTVKNEAAVCKYLDLPIQHITDKILKRMNRRVTKKKIASLIEFLRKSVPGIAIRTTVMVGFPGESEKDFRELENFVREVKFERLGAFMYSREEGTGAYDFDGQVAESAKKERFDRIMRLQQGIAGEVNAAYIGRTLKVLIDEKDKSAAGEYTGRTEYDAPEVDGTVRVKSGAPLKEGDFADVKIEGVLEYDLTGSVV